MLNNNLHDLSSQISSNKWLSGVLFYVYKRIKTQEKLTLGHKIEGGGHKGANN